MSSILIVLTSNEWQSDRFRYYEIYANETDIPDDDDVESDADFSAIEFGNYFPHVGLAGGSSWYHWARAVYDDGSVKSPFVKFGPTSAPSSGVIVASDISDASADAISLITAANFAAMRTLLSPHGTFTPTIVGQTSPGSATYSAQIGRYTVVGNRVLFSIQIAWSGHTGTGNMTVAGLPITTEATIGNAPPLSVIASSITYADSLAAQIIRNSTSIQLYTQASAASLGLVAMSAAGSLSIAGHYEI